MFGAQPSSSAFGTPSSTPAFGTPSSMPAFGTPASSPAFGTPASTPAFGTPAPAFGTPSSTPAFSSALFSSPFSQQSQPQPQPQQPFQSGFFQNQQQTMPFGQTAAAPMSFPTFQLTTQMAPVAPLPFSLADRDIQVIVDSYKDEPGNPKYAFKHLLFSVTDSHNRVKPAGVSDIMWAEAMGKLEGMESSNRERLWPQLVQGFKDLSQRLKLQDEVMISDTERLKMTQNNVKMLQRHFQVDTLPRVQRLRQKEHVLQRRILRVMRIVEGLEGKGCRLPFMKGEAELAEKLVAVTRQLKGSGADLSKRVQNLLTVSRAQATNGFGGSVYLLPGSTKIHEQSFTDMQEVLQQQTEAISRLGNVLKRDIRNMEIIMADDTKVPEEKN